MPVDSNLFVPKKPIERKVRINSSLQKTFCNYASVLSNDYVTDHIPSINPFFLRMLDDLSTILDKAGGWRDD